MKKDLSWPFVFFAVIVFYLIFYAPFGINESDGGFMTGYTWQWLCGKKLYAEICYVRPPLPVWLRAAEIALLPETWQTLGERYIFYLKVALYCWLAADFLDKKWRWQVATFGFVVSIHCYPPMSLHTFDGILFSVLAFWLWGKNWAMAAAISAVAAAMCKQSFYPIPVVFFAFLIWQKNWKVLARAAAGAALAAISFWLFMLWDGTFDAYIRRTAAASDSGMLLQQGVFNLFKINPMVAAGMVFIFLFSFLGEKFFLPENENSNRPDRPVFSFQNFYRTLFASRIFIPASVVWLAATYVFQIFQRQEFTIPVAQSKIIFWLATAWFLGKYFFENERQNALRLAAMLAITWCCTVSWGYSFPIQFAVPGVFVLAKSAAESGRKPQSWSWLAALILLLGVFRYSYEYVYRDGVRSEMHYHIGDIYPRARGIFSDKKTFEKYMEVHLLWEKYEGDKVVLPWFTQVHFLENTCPILPLDWVVNREMNGDTALIFSILREKHPLVLVEKSQLSLIGNDPEHVVSKTVVEQWKLIAEGEFYLVFKEFESR